MLKTVQMVDSVKVSHKTVWSKFIPYVVLIVLEIFIDGKLT